MGIIVQPDSEYSALIIATIAAAVIYVAWALLSHNDSEDGGDWL